MKSEPQSVCVYVCVRVWGNEKGEVKDQIRATLVSTQGHDKRVRERLHQNHFFSGEHDIPAHKLKTNTGNQEEKITSVCGFCYGMTLVLNHHEHIITQQHNSCASNYDDSKSTN